MNDSIDARKAAAALRRAVSEVFADMAFLDVACVEGGEPVAYEVRAAIDILKPLSCRLELRMPRGLSEAIVDTLGPEEAQMEDVVLELVNVLAGSFISAYFGPGAAMKLELPQYLCEPAWEGGSPIACIECDAEGATFCALISSVRYRY